MDHGRAVAYGSVVDHDSGGRKAHKSLPQAREKGEGSIGNLTSGDFGRRRGCVRLATWKHGGSQQISLRSSSE
jgi:hypothetical protein